MRKLVFGALLLGVAVLAAVAALAAAPLYVYGRLTHEAPIAELYFTPLRPGVWRAHVSNGPRCAFAAFELWGDEWRLDASFLKWTPRASLLGLDPLYRVERISGRWRSVADENSKPQRAYALAPRLYLDPFRLTEGHWLIDTIYGSSVYDSIDPSKQYRVFHSASGIFVRAVDGAGAAPLRACDDRLGLLERISQQVNDSL